MEIQYSRLETLPGPCRWHFFDEGRPGTSAPAWETPLGQVATPICIDNDFSPVVREAVVAGAEFLLVPSMDAAHWTARQHLQHAELFRHRAAENGHWMAVASTSGLTQILDPSGRVTAALPLFEPGVLIGEISTRSPLTPFTRFGHWIGPAPACSRQSFWSSRGGPKAELPNAEVKPHPRPRPITRGEGGIFHSLLAAEVSPGLAGGVPWQSTR